MKEKKIKEFVREVADGKYSRGRIVPFNISKFTQDLTNLIDSKWIKCYDKLPPKENEFYPFSIYVVVICQQELNSKKQVANAYYNYETDIWETHWGKVINDVEFWTTKPPKE